MNIFAYDPDPWTSAMWLDDVRKNKMITETCQILSTACNVIVPDHRYDLMKSFNPAHGSNEWARKNIGNFMWLCEYLECLQTQRPTNSNGELHECIRRGLLMQFRGFAIEHREAFHPDGWTMHSNNAAVGKPINVSFKHIPDVYLAYKLYHTYRWSIDNIKLSWEFGEEPNWRRNLKPENFL